MDFGERSIKQLSIGPNKHQIILELLIILVLIGLDLLLDSLEINRVFHDLSIGWNIHSNWIDWQQKRSGQGAVLDKPEDFIAPLKMEVLVEIHSFQINSGLSFGLLWKIGTAEQNRIGVPSSGLLGNSERVPRRHQGLNQLLELLSQLEPRGLLLGLH